MILKKFSVFYMLLFLGLAATIARGQASMQRGVRISNSNGNIVSIQTGTGTATYTLSLPLTVNPALTTASVLYGIGTGNLNWTDVTGVAAGSILTLQNSGGNLVPVWVAPSGAGDWLLIGNSITSGWDGTAGSFLGTTNTQPLVLATTNTATSQPIEFFTNNTERMRLSGAGFLGIGQTNPSQMLEVRNGNFLLSNSGSADQLQFQGTGSGITTFQAGAQGATNINYTLPTAAAAANNYVLVSTTGGVMSWADANTLVSGNYWSLTGNATTSAWNGTTGNFLGTTTTQPLVIATTNTATAQPIEFYTNNVEAMRLSAAGELGIGVTPVAGRLLDVGGTAGTPNIRFTSLSAATPGSTGRLVLADGNGDLQALAFPGSAGQVLSSSTSGGLSWTTPVTGVTSVGLALPVSVFNVTGSPVTSVGTLTGSFTTQSANTVFAGPVSGAAAVPTFRSLVPADLPSLNSLAWLINGNSGTTAWNGTTGNFLGTTDAQPLVVGTTYTTTAQPMEFFTNNTERMRLSALGNLGIGQTNPSQLLEVRNGNFLLSNSGSADQLQFQGTGSGITTFQAGAQGATNINYTLPISAAAANNYVLVSTTGGVMSWADPNSIVTGNFWSLNGNAIASAWNGTTGNFLGTTSTQPLVIATTNTTTAQPMEFFTGNTERMRLSAAGNLGIGQTNPSQLLEVRNGNLLLSNSGTADQLQFQGTSTGATTFSAGAQGVTNLNYTLPIAAPSANSLLYSSGGTTSNLSWTNTGTSGQVLTITGGVPSWQTSSGWLTTGNSGQVDNTSNLLGTLDNKPVRFIAGATGTPNTRMLLDYSRGDLLLGANSGTAGFTSTGGGRFAMGNALTTTTLNSIPTVSSRTFNMIDSNAALRLWTYNGLTGTADPTIELIGGTNTNQGNAANTWWDMYTTGTPYSTTAGTHSSGEHFALRRRTGTVDSEMVSVFASGNVGIGADGAGSAGTVSNAGNRLTVSNNDAVTSSITNVVALQHNSTGTPAANFGTGLLFRGKDSTSRNQDMASVNAIWTAANHSNHVSALTFSTDSIGVTTPTEKVRIAGNGYVGVNTTNPGVRMHINGGYATTSSTDTLTAATNNDVPVGDCAYLRLYSTSPFTITGLAAGVDGQRLRIVDITGVDMTVANGSTLSAAGNRIETDVGSDIIVRGTVPVLDMTYDAGLGEWLLGTLNANQIVGGVGSIIYAVKTADQNVTNSTVLVNDNDLSFTVSPNQTWEINGELDAENTNNNVGIKIALTIPAASSMKVDFTAIASAGGNAITGEDALSASGVAKNISILSLQPSLINVRGIIVTGANGGTIQLKWAQVTASANSTTLKAQSYMKLIRVK